MEYHVTSRGVFVAQRIIMGIPVNPLNGPVEPLDHIRRTEEEIKLWLWQPYVVKRNSQWQVRCLDCNCFDRPSRWETLNTLGGAISTARQQSRS
jgi:hypothetical protein